MISTKTLTKPFYSLPAVCALTGLGPHAINKRVQRGGLKTFFIGRKQFIKVEDVLKIVRGRNETT